MKMVAHYASLTQELCEVDCTHPFYEFEKKLLNKAVTHLREYFHQEEGAHSIKMFDLRREFPNQWNKFLHPAEPSEGNTFELDMSAEMFPIMDQGKTLEVKTIWLLAHCTDSVNYEVEIMPLIPAEGSITTITLVPNNQYGGMYFGLKENVDFEINPANPPVRWRLGMIHADGGNLQEGEVKDMWGIVGSELVPFLDNIFSSHVWLSLFSS